MKTAELRLYRFAFAATLITIAFFSLRSRSGHELFAVPSFTPSAFEMHVLAYAVAVILGIRAFGFSIRLSAGLILYGISLEAAQHFIPSRAFNPFDALANTVGILLGSTLLFSLKKWCAGGTVP